MAFPPAIDPSESTDVAGTGGTPCAASSAAMFWSIDRSVGTTPGAGCGCVALRQPAACELGPAGATSLASCSGLADLKDLAPAASREAEEEGRARGVGARPDAAVASAEVVPPLAAPFSSSSIAASALAPTVTPLSTLFVFACAVDSVDDSAS